ncbi:hypothetical protein NL317_28920, partial [Klebsiella pneumoniae]|nr:hypothetical protein [Klebsiella pneumoniae]
ADNRIYITNSNSQIGKLLAIHRSTLAQERSYSFTPTHSYRVAAGKVGRVVMETETGAEISIFDTLNGTKKSSIMLGKGGGTFDPEGQF